MIRIILNDTDRETLRSLRRTALAPKVRDRIEMVTLSDAGWSPPEIARHLGCHPLTVRDSLRAFLGRGTAALHPFRSGPAPDVQRYQSIAGALRELLDEDRTWTSGQLSRALAERGLVLGPRQVRRYLKRMGARYRRTASTLRHEQDPAKAERAARVLDNLKAKAAAGSLDLSYLDECGFSPTLPVGQTWSLAGQRKLVRYEAPQGRRVNAMAAYRPDGRSPRLEVFRAERTWDAYDLIGFLGALPRARCPRVVVMDSDSIHTGGIVRRMRKSLSRRGIYLYYLPPYSPQFNRVEAVFRQVKYHEMPRRSFTSRSGLREAVELAFGNYGRSMHPKDSKSLRPAA